MNRLLERIFNAMDWLSKLTVVGLVAGTIYMFAIYWQAIATAARWAR